MANAEIRLICHHEGECHNAGAPHTTGISQRGTMTGMCLLNFSEKQSCSPFLTSFAEIVP
jgi:hypothetical protein